MDWLRLESSAYWMAFTVTFLFVAMWESWRPERELKISAGRRWTVHGVLMVSGAAVRLAVVRLSPVAAALYVAETRETMLQRTSLWVAIPLTVLMLDFAKYVTHRLFHSVGWLWRVHRVHHSDPDFDVSTGLRFHPLEPFLPQLADLGLILLVGPPVAAVVTATVLAAVINFLEHANATLPPKWEKALGTVFVTARMHRVHHSEAMADQQSNYGELFSWWDKLLGTYRAEPASAGIGLRGYQDARSMGLSDMLLQPFQASREPQARESLLAASAQDEKAT